MGVYTVETSSFNNFFVKEYLLRRYTANNIPFHVRSLQVVDGDLNSILLNEENELEIVYMAHSVRNLTA